MDSFDYETWAEAGEAAAAGQGYYTFANSLEVPLTIAGIAVMVAALAAWVITERNHLEASARTLRSEMGGGER